MLADRGLIKGGNIDNAVVIIDHEIDEKGLNRLKEKLGLPKDINLNHEGF